jgi:hypothetical protein
MVTTSVFETFIGLRVALNKSRSVLTRYVDPSLAALLRTGHAQDSDG